MSGIKNGANNAVTVTREQLTSLSPSLLSHPVPYTHDTAGRRTSMRTWPSGGRTYR